MCCVPFCFRIAHGFIKDYHTNMSEINTNSNHYNMKVLSVSGDRNRGGDYETEVVVYDFGKQLAYECEPGYVLHHDGVNSEFHITCEQNGAWKGEVAYCVMIQCPAPLPLEHGSVTLRNNDRVTTSDKQNASNVTRDGSVYLYGSEIELSCEVGYRLLGPSILECMESGKWSFAESQCERVVCALSTLVLYSDPPTAITDNGAFSISGNFYDDLADFTCKPGYRFTLPMFSSSSLSLMKLTWTCQLNGSWMLFNNIDTGSEFMDAILKRGQALCQPFQHKCPEPKVRFLCYINA
jgi:hypothetical protein